MEITEVRVKLLEGRSDRLRAFCSMTIDEEFVVHDLRVIDGRKGMFVAMPSRKLSDNCPNCGGKNHLRAAYCNDCGQKLDENRAEERDKYHVDVAHPIVTDCRDKVQSTVLEAYHQDVAEKGEEQPTAPGVEEEPDEALEENHEQEELEAGEVEEEQEEEEYLEEAEEPEEEEEEVEEIEELEEIEAEEAEEEEAPTVAEEPGQAPEPFEPDEEEEPEEEAPEEEEEEEEESGGFGAGIFG